MQFSFFSEVHCTRHSLVNFVYFQMDYYFSTSLTITKADVTEARSLKDSPVPHAMYSIGPT